MVYKFFKYLHIFTINTTFIFFVIRSYWTLICSPLITQGWVRILPHVNDTILLIAAIIMTYLQGAQLFSHGWLLAKLAAVIVYIFLASIALRRNRSKLIRLIAWILAIIVFFYIVVVAVSKDPWPFL